MTASGVKPTNLSRTRALTAIESSSGSAVTDGVDWSTSSIGSGIIVSDEGTPLATLATTLDFVGSGVTASGTGAVKTITITGGASALPWFDVTAAAYGATGNGTTDDTTAINLAIAALNTATRGVLYFPAGTYKTTSALTTITAICSVRGDGIEASKVTSTSATAYLFTVSADGATFSDLWMVNTAATPTAGAAIRATSGTVNRYENLAIQAFYTGIRHEDGLAWAMRAVYIDNPRAYGIHISNAATPDEGDWTIAECYLSAGANSPTSAIRVDSSGGGKISGVKINGNTSGFANGIDVAIPTATTTSVLTVTGCSIENVRTHAITITTAGTGQFGLIAISGLQAALYSNNSGRVVNISAASAGGLGTAGGIGDVVIDGIAARTDGTARAAISLTNTDHVTLGDMALAGFNDRYTSSGDTNTTDTSTSGGGVASGTSFPGSPATNDRFYRTDHALEYAYDGTRWLCTCAHLTQFGVGNTLAPDSVGTAWGRLAAPSALDLWITAWVVGTYVATTNNGTNYWSVTLSKYDSADSQTTIDSFNTSADSANAWVRRRRTVGAVYAQASFVGMRVAGGKVLSPGSAYFEGPLLEYRLIGT